MEITLPISFLCLLTYTVSMIKMFGVPASLSDTYYLLQNKYPNKPTKWLFTILCFTTMFTVLIPWLDISKEPLQFLCFIAASGLGFVGAAPHFKSYEYKIHVAGTVLCALGSQLWLWLSGYWYTSLIALALMAIPAFKQKKNYIFYAEMAAFLSAYLGIGIEYLKKLI